MIHYNLYAMNKIYNKRKIYINKWKRKRYNYNERYNKRENIMWRQNILKTKGGDCIYYEEIIL